MQTPVSVKPVRYTSKHDSGGQAAGFSSVKMHGRKEAKLLLLQISKEAWLKCTAPASQA
jgi:hypothetical protein